VNTIAVLQRAAELSLKLGIEERDTLTYEPVECCPDLFRETLRDHKPQLLALLQLPFVMIYSQSVEQTLFFCADDQTRQALIDAGADSFAIYTKAELRELIEQNRVAPFTNAELRKVHEIKRSFNAKITPR
jgi:hypothetical protein